MSSAAAVPCILTVRRPSQATVPGSPLLAKNSPPDCFFYAQTLSGSSPAQKLKEPRLRLFLIWCRRRDLSSAAAAPCILTVRRPSQATVPGSPLLAKNSPPDCFFTLRPSRVQAPQKNKKSRICDSSLFGAGEGT